MSEFQKFNCMLLHGIPCMMPKEEGFWVQSFDHDAALSQLAALREELAEFKRVYIASTGREVKLQQRLADAERRNADYEFNLMYLRSQIGNSVLVAYIDAALTKPEEAKS